MTFRLFLVLALLYTPHHPLVADLEVCHPSSVYFPGGMFKPWNSLITVTAPILKWETASYSPNSNVSLPT